MPYRIPLLLQAVVLVAEARPSLPAAQAPKAGAGAEPRPAAAGAREFTSEPAVVRGRAGTVVAGWSWLVKKPPAAGERAKFGPGAVVVAVAVEGFLSAAASARMASRKRSVLQRAPSKAKSKLRLGRDSAHFPTLCAREARHARSEPVFRSN